MFRRAVGGLDGLELFPEALHLFLSFNILGFKYLLIGPDLPEFVALQRDNFFEIFDQAAEFLGRNTYMSDLRTNVLTCIEPLQLDLLMWRSLLLLSS
jgi:hypothetical protein